MSQLVAQHDLASRLMAGSPLTDKQRLARLEALAVLLARHALTGEGQRAKPYEDFIHEIASELMQDPRTENED